MRWLLLLLCLAFPRTSSGNGCEKQHQWLWRVAGREAEAAFFGTIHVAHSLVRVGRAAVRAFDRADRVLFELDLTDPRVARRLASCQRLPHGTTLSDVLPGELYLRLKRHLDHAKHLIPGWEFYPDYLVKAFAGGGWERRRPGWALLLLESLEGGGGGWGGAAVLDLWLARRALRMGKRPGAVERPEEHCLPLNALAPQQVVWALNRSLSRLEGEGGKTSPTKDLIRRYNCGQLPPFTLQEEEEEVERYFRRELIEKRNVRMAQRVVRLLRDHPTQSFFFAFGAGHFLGNGSVLDLVRDAGGFRVERVTSDISSWGEEEEHQGALRSVAPPPKHRHFNDLWVKMDRTLEEEQSDQRADAEPSLASSLALDPLLCWATLVVFLAMVR